MINTMDQYLAQMRHAIVWHREAMEKARAGGDQVIDDEIIFGDAAPTYAERMAELGAATVSCPFCKEDGFDLVGLRAHYDLMWCDTLKDTPGL